MHKLLLLILGLILLIAIAALTLIWTGLPMRPLQFPATTPIGAIDDSAADPARPEVFTPGAPRVVPFEMLYPARSAGTPAHYVPDAPPLIAAMFERQGRVMALALGRIGSIEAPWTSRASPAGGGPFPVILYLPGATGYMQMGSFQTTALAAHGYVVVTLDQPGAVSAAVLPDGLIVPGMTRAEVSALIGPSYHATGTPLPDRFATALAPDISIIPYLAADATLVLNRLAQINADPAHPLHGRLDLDHVGVMGMSLGAIVTAQVCAIDPRFTACLMMDAPVPAAVAASGLRQPALWISRPAADQRKERDASGGWPEDEIAAQARSIDLAVANSDQARLVMLDGLFHVDFTDLPAIQPVIGWAGQSGPVGFVQAQRQINALTTAFFDRAFGRTTP